VAGQLGQCTQEPEDLENSMESEQKRKWEEAEDSDRQESPDEWINPEKNRRYYIQSAFAILNKGKQKQETMPFMKIQDSFKKIVVVKEDIVPWHDESGILYMGVEQFLLDETAIDQ